MPISATGNRRSAGFTLVELMIVVTVIALVSAVAVLAIPDPRGRLIAEAERFAARTRAAHDSAIIEGRSVSVWISDGGYGFDRRAGGAWQPIADKPLRVERWGRDVEPMVIADGARDRVIFDSTGMANAPLDVELRRDRERVLVRIAGDGTVAVGG